MTAKPWSRFTEDAGNTLVAALVFLGSLAVYTVTMNPSVPFWDSGEYIATSYILGVPHPPGTPLYVLIGRVFTLLPFGSVAQNVNWLSALSSALTLLFTYLISVKVARRLFAWEKDPFHKVMSYLAGFTAALLAGFATTFWDNAVEAEVYAAACAIMTFLVWMVMRWEERLGEGTEDGLLLVITYVVGLGVGIHLGVAIAAWAAVAFVFVCRPHYLKRYDYLAWAVVTLSLGVGINDFTFWVAPVVLGLTLARWALTGRLSRLAAWASVLFIAGVSVHFYLLIRSNLDPAINEAAPKDWESLWLMLTRDQYKPGSPFDRRAPWDYQIDTMWLRYLRWNFTLFTAAGRPFFQLPLLLAVAGAVVHAMRDRRSFVILAILFVFLGPAMVFYLNFKDPEVRERDYFFVQNFQFLAIWVGIGAAWVTETVRRQVRAPGLRGAAGGALVGLFAGMAVLPVFHNWHSHDRRGFLVARDYAYNMLVALEPDAIIFTNGDNDTFPLWYLQEVEGVRKDVRVVNLSLLNTEWYIRQLRDIPPRVPLELTDGQIDTITDLMIHIWERFQALSRQVPAPPPDPQVLANWSGADIERFWNLMRETVERERQGMTVKHMAVDVILKDNAYRRPVYIAVTVPEIMGLDAQLVMEGLAFRVASTPAGRGIDVDKTLHNLHQVYRYSGLVAPDPAAPPGVIGRHDFSVYKDDNASKLTQNYAAAFSRSAIELMERGEDAAALREMTNAEIVAPDFQGIALAKGYILERMEDWAGAEEHYRRTAAKYPRDWNLRNRLAVSLLQLDRYDEAIETFREARVVDPARWEPVQGIITACLGAGRNQDALAAVEEWLATHPQDARARQTLEQIRQVIDAGISFPDAQGVTPDTSGAPGGGR